MYNVLSIVNQRAVKESFWTNSINVKKYNNENYSQLKQIYIKVMNIDNDEYLVETNI